MARSKDAPKTKPSPIKPSPSSGSPVGPQPIPIQFQAEQVFAGSNELAEAIGSLPQIKIGLRLRQAKVVSTQTGPPLSLTIKLGASTSSVAGVRYLASYSSPAANDIVWVLQSGPDLLVLGKLA